jgi:hypothetical protein
MAFHRIVPLALLIALSACNGLDSSLGNPLGQDFVSAGGLTFPPGFGNIPPVGSGGGQPIGTGCHNTDGTHICLGLKYVAYNNGSQATVSQAAAIADVSGINNIWAQCNIAFQIDQYQAINPGDDGFNFDPANIEEFDPIRGKLNDGKTLLVVTTGTWNRSGDLGNSGANAWTNLPGTSPYGAILEQPVGTFPNIVAHELGHYLNLNHISDQSDLMNPIIYDSSINLSAVQCDAARSAASAVWTSMLR